MMSSQHQILSGQLPRKATLHEAGHVCEQEHPARTGADRQHAGLAIAVPGAEIGFGMKHGKIHPVPTPAAPPMAPRSSGAQEGRLGEKRLRGGQAAGMIPIAMG
mgnify:CR=1 FL=1